MKLQPMISDVIGLEETIMLPLQFILDNNV